MRWFLMVAVLLLALPVAAETVYVTDSITVDMLAGPDKDAPLIKTLTTGAKLTVLERRGSYALLRDAGGTEGWIQNDVLTTEVPAALLLGNARDELNRARSRLISLKNDLDAAQEKLTETQRELDDKSARNAELEQLVAEYKRQPPVAATPPAFERARAEVVPLETTRHVWVWPVVAFAMLVIGFLAGIAWLREQNRRKLGGMHLRI